MSAHATQATTSDKCMFDRLEDANQDQNLMRVKVCDDCPFGFACPAYRKGVQRCVVGYFPMTLTLFAILVLAALCAPILSTWL